jgi:type I restriction enzyme, R subunit
MRLEVEPSSGEVGSMSSLTEVGQGDDAESVEDQINRIMAARKMLPNASYFTATPKNRH